ncbi:hypothetical protein LV779_08860 [Streptomyces thinghirensis]|nr:hypothetical protein [Streptomyces thinghirensis]
MTTAVDHAVGGELRHRQLRVLKALLGQPARRGPADGEAPLPRAAPGHRRRGRRRPGGIQRLC